MFGILSRIVGFIIATFILAMLFGVIYATVDFLGSDYNGPEDSGHRAARKVYNIFGTVSEEIKRNDQDESVTTQTILRKIAMPYALTADLSAMLTGQLEVEMASLLHRHV